MKRRILVIDDEPDMTFSLRLLLEATGNYAVKEVNDPREALSIAREFQPELILLDLIMPGIDGSDLAVQFVSDESFHHVPIVFMTALVSREETMKDACYTSGGRTYLPKPFEAADLICCIERKLTEEERPILSIRRSRVSLPHPLGAGKA